MLIFSKNKAIQSARKQISIQSIEDDVLTLTNNQNKAILEISSINFELKSEAEQDIITNIYQDFLNSLPCDIQIYIQTREVDLDRYLQNFYQLFEKNNIAYKDQLNNYTEFVCRLIDTNKILSRHFYLIVSENHRQNQSLNEEQLKINCEIITKGLSKIGLQTKRLNTFEILNLFYNFYNPNLSKNQPLHNQSIEFIKKDIL